MAEQSGPSMAAIRAGREELAVRLRDSAEADRALARALAEAHTAAATARSHLDAIAAEVEDRVRKHASPAVDTPLGAHEFQRYLLDRQRELIAVVEAACRDEAAGRALLERLRARYASAP